MKIHYEDKYIDEKRLRNIIKAYVNEGVEELVEGMERNGENKCINHIVGRMTKEFHLTEDDVKRDVLWACRNLDSSLYEADKNDFRADADMMKRVSDSFVKLIRSYND